MHDIRRMSLADLEVLTGVTYKTIRKRLEEAEVKPKRTDGRAMLYETQEALPAIFKTADGDELDLTRERARLASSQADKVEYEVKVLEKSLLDAHDVRMSWEKLILDCKAKLKSIPAQYSPLLEGKNTKERRGILEGAIDIGLKELSKPSNFDGSEVDGGEE